MTEAKGKVEKDKTMQNIQSREQIEKMRDANNELQKQRDKFEEDYLKASEDVRTLNVDKDRLRARIIKYKNRKGKVDAGIKTCKNCGKEFHENSNFNWSCNIHTSTYDSDTLQWWCCAKIGKDQKGCKVQKHEVQNEVDDEDDDKQDDNAYKNLKQQRCLCCKQLGHSIDQCERDPNMKTSNIGREDIENEF